MKNTNTRTRFLAFCLAALILVGILPMTASASTIADGSRTCTIAPVERHYYLATTAGTRLGASAYQYTTNDGLSGAAYCVDHGLDYSSHALEIRGKYASSPQTAGAFANGYPQHSLATFLGRFPNETLLEGLTESEYAYATQLAVWATLGQLGIEGTAFTAGRETVSQPIGDAQQVRIFRAVQLILDTAKRWDRVYQTGMYIRLEEDALGGNISIPGDMTLEFAADQEQYGLKREVIGGTAYYTREYIFASATSTYYSNYNIELWADGAPAGTIFVDTNNQELPRGTFHETATWSLPTTNRNTNLNDNGFEYAGKAKLCIPVDTAPNQGEITVRCASYIMQYEIYLAHNEVVYEQSYIIADPSKGTQTANAVLKWGSEQTEFGALQVTKVGGGGQALAGATFTLVGSDGSSRSGTTDSDGVIRWTELKPTVEYTLSETDPPAGYAVIDPINIRVQAARINYVTVQDATEKQLTVRKIDAQTGYSLRGATIAFRQIDGSFFTTAVTDHAGVIQLDANALPVGSYEVYEQAAPEGYELDQSVQTVRWDGRNDVALTFKNVRKPTLIIYKCDADNTRSLPGATIAVYKDGQLFTTVTTNDNGLAYVPGVTRGYYTVKETVAPAGYMLDTAEHSVYVDAYDPATTDDPRIVIPNGAKPHLRIRKYDEQTMQALANTTFEVYRDGTLLGQYTTDAVGEVLLFDLQPGTYLVKEIAVQPGYVVNSTPQQIEITAGHENYSLVFLNLMKPGVRIVKLDSQTLKALAGARFRVSALGGTFSGEFTTNPEGEIVLDALDPGAYEIEELAAPDGYLIDGGKRTMQVNAGENAELVFTDTVKPSLLIEKKDARTLQPLAGALFSIIRLGSDDAPTERTTDRNGQIRIDGMEPGMYSVQEITAPDGYARNGTEYHVQLVPGEVSSLLVKNSQRPDLRIAKYDAQTRAPLTGAKFEVYADTRLVGSYLTDANGEILLYDLDPGVYLVKEVAAPASHTVNTAPQEIELVAGASATYNLVFLDTVKPGIHILKLDSEALLPLAGAKFRVAQIGGGYCKELLTDSNGEIDLSGLEPAAYEITELSAPAGYLIDEASRTVRISAGEDAEFVFTDTERPVLVIRKQDAADASPLPGATFRIARIEDGSHYLDRITDTTGEISISDLEPGVYSVSELSAPEGYIPLTQEYRVELLPGQQSTLVLSNDRKPDLKIIKRDADTGLPLSGATFRINRADGSTLTAKQTDENGEIFLENLEPGAYQVTETVPPVGYLPAQQPTQLITLEPNKLGTVIFENHVQPDLTVNKLDSITGDPIQGAKFHITYGSSNTTTGEINDLGDYFTDENGQIRLTELKDGWYRVSELEPAAGYAIKEPATQELYLRAGESKVISFQNTPLSALVVYKYDSVTGAAVEGAVFQVKYLTGASGTGGTVIGTYKTSVNGSFTVTGLKAGTYVAEELASDDGHVIDTAPQTAYLSGKEQDVAQLYFGNSPKGGLVVKKVDAVTGAPLSDVEFMVTMTDGTVVGSANGKFVTDRTGCFTVDGLDPGTSLVVKETRAKAGYVLDDTAQTVTVIPGRSISLEFRNAPKGSLIIVKKDAVTGAVLKGVTFKITSSDGRYVANAEGKISSNGLYYTDENGQIILTGLTPDTYVVTEIAAIPGYVLDSTPQTVAVCADDTQTLTFVNTPEGGLVVIKSDEDTGERIKGARFEIRKVNGEIVGTYTTDRNGVIQLPDAAAGWYVVTEVKAAAGYRLDATPAHVEVKDGETAYLDLTNVRFSGISIHKTDSVTGYGIYGVRFMVYDRDNRPIEQLVTDQNGYAYTETELTAGRYYVREIEAAEGYLADTQDKSIYVSVGRIATIEWKNAPVTGQIQVTKTSADYNSVNGWLAGTPIPNTVFEVYNKAGRLVDTIRTDKNGVAATKPLLLGRYTIIESQAASFYALDKTPIEVEIEFAGQIVKAAMTDKSLYTNVSVTKRGYSEVMPGQSIRYDYSGIANNSTTALDSFYWRDTLPTGAVRLDKIVTGTWSAQGSYKLVYKTNYSTEYKLLADNLSTAKNYVLDASPAALGLANGEYVTEFMAVFGIVPSGFRQVDAPKVYCTVLSTLAGGTEFTNVADAGGVYDSQWIMAVSRWVTTVYKPAEPPKPLPRTGY